MAEKRNSPFVWVTWLSKLMSGEISCEWAPWFRSHYQAYDKAPSDFDLATWNIRHTRLLREIRLQRQQAGDEVLVEGQAQFYYERPNSGLVLSGKPDLVSFSGNTLTVHDAKTGQPRASDQIQVMIYMYCLPIARPEFASRTLAGQVVYESRSVGIPPSAVGSDFEKDFNYFLDVLESDTHPHKAPSENECRFCDIGPLSCPERVTAP
ncbi:MAG: PD-(D/E)XK nuclease family protein [Dehalococcoidia bacterium]|nr:PD-(D/E)XK nuclease family protein [Dehalococcoidia bacterium]